VSEPTLLVQTRQSLHAVAEQVLAAARHRATGRIGLRVTPGGFGTPPFPGPDGERRITIEGTDLVVRTGAQERRAPLTTVAAAAELVGIEPGAPADVYAPATPFEPTRPLSIDPTAADRLASFFAVVDQALVRLRGDDATESEAQLWPEHFDLATTIDEVNYGGSPGDDGHLLPYLYVGPWSLPDDGDPFWNEAFGASTTAESSVTVEATVAFFESGRNRLPG